MRSFRALACSFGLTFKIPVVLRALLRDFALAEGRPGSILGRPDAPGLDFAGRNASIFARCRCARVCCAHFVRCQQNTIKTDAKRTSELARDDAKTTKNRSTGVFDSARCTKRAHAMLRGRLGASWDRPGKALGRFRTDLGSPGASQDRPQGGIWMPQSRPERIRTHPRNSPGHPERRKIDFPSILRGFGFNFRRFSNDFSSIFVRAAGDEVTKSESQKGGA